MDFISLVPSSLSADQNNATYSCSFLNTWSAENHPILYNSIESSAHWSPPVLTAHGEGYDMWAPEKLASPGVQFVAEMGATSQLEQEILAAQTNGLAGKSWIGTAQFNLSDGPQTFEDVQLTPEFPLLSTISMMAPSPDWFTGIPGFSPIDETEGVWYESFEIHTYPWDAGTEMGDTYSLNNNAQVPPNPITQLTVDTVPENGILLDPSETTVLPVAVWSCTLKQETVSTDPVTSDPPPEEEEVTIPDQEQETVSTDPVTSDPPPEEEEVTIPDQEQEDEIIVIVEDNPPSNENQNEGVCSRYFRACGEDSECCSGNCERQRCGGRARGTGRDISLRLSSQGGTIVGGAAGRRGRNGWLRRGSQSSIP